MEDIDLLVWPADRAAAARILIGLGFSDVTFGPEDFRNPDSGITIDLHDEPLNCTRIPIRRNAWQPDLAAWQQRSRPMPGYPHLNALSPSDLLEYLCYHYWLHHGLRNPRGMLDICLALHANGETGARDDSAEPRSGWSSNRGMWYAVEACRCRLGIKLRTNFLRGLQPVEIGIVERLVHRIGTSGLLPDFARYGYLVTALSRQEQREFFHQVFWAARNALRTQP